MAALRTFIRDVSHNRSLRGAVINLSLGLSGTGEDALTEPASLRLLLEVANALGMVIVAAAGNDSAPKAGSRPAQIPAAWDFVIGVAACNYDRKLACFSNAGDILAPGGGGVDPFCLPGLDRCRGADCRYALISLSTATWTGFSYGVGSSYAAPLITGLAACILSAIGPLPGIKVKQQLLAHAAGDGIANGQGLP
jgi:subtilisin family serine protease